MRLIKLEKHHGIRCQNCGRTALVKDMPKKCGCGNVFRVVKKGWRYIEVEVLTMDGKMGELFDFDMLKKKK